MQMTQHIRLTLCAAFAGIVAVAGQQNEPAGNLPEPEFANVFFRLIDGKLISLERQTATVHVHAGGFIVHDASGEGEVRGARSPVRFQHTDTFDLVVRCPAALADEDPDTVYRLRVLNVKKHMRQWLFASGGAVGGVHASVKSRSDGILPVKWSKYAGSSLIMNTGSLPPGEYAVGRVQQGGTMTVFCFGVD
jgi:hypothetical protein